MSVLYNINAGLRFLLEVVCIIIAGRFGFSLSENRFFRFVAAIVLPMIIIVVWSFFGAPKSAYRLDSFYKLGLEIVIFTASACMLLRIRKTLFLPFAVLLLINTVLLYVFEH